MIVQQRRQQRRPRFRLAGDEASALIERKILHRRLNCATSGRVLQCPWLSSGEEGGISQSESTSHNLSSVIDLLLGDPSSRSAGFGMTAVLFRAARFQKPINKALQAVAEFRLWVVAEKFAGFRNIGTGQRHVARVFRQAIDLRFLT